MRVATLLLLILIIAVIGAGVAWALGGRDRPPKHAAIEQAYFICHRCQSAQGGIYGKGPFKEFRSKTAEACVHDWSRVSRDEFKGFATTVYHQDWSKEIPFWNQ